MRGVALGLVAIAASLGCATGGSMTQQGLAEHLGTIAGRTDVEGASVTFEFEGVPITCVSDAEHDRMRLIAPVAKQEALAAEHLRILLIANFHTTLDARYALSQGFVVASFLHPLSSLTRAELESAVRQVAALARNFGTSYSSDELTYGLPDPEPGQEL